MSRKRSHNQMQLDFRPETGELFWAFENGYICIKKLYIETFASLFKTEDCYSQFIGFFWVCNAVITDNSSLYDLASRCTTSLSHQSELASRYSNLTKSLYDLASRCTTSLSHQSDLASHYSDWLSRYSDVGYRYSDLLCLIHINGKRF